jgi:RimJ/RimL family protein N-acetyltransferase
MEEAAVAVLDFAKQQIKLQLIEAQTNVNNKRATRLLEKLGFFQTSSSEDSFNTFRLRLS